MALIDLISEEIVKVPLVSQNKPDIIRELVQVLKGSDKITGFDPAYEAVMAREDQGSTGRELRYCRSSCQDRGGEEPDHRHRHFAPGSLFSSCRRKAVPSLLPPPGGPRPTGSPH